MVGHGGSSAGSYLANPTSPIPFHCASIVATSTLRVKGHSFHGWGTLEVASVHVCTYVPTKTPVRRSEGSSAVTRLTANSYGTGSDLVIYKLQKRLDVFHDITR